MVELGVEMEYFNGLFARDDNHSFFFSTPYSRFFFSLPFSKSIVKTLNSALT